MQQSHKVCYAEYGRKLGTRIAVEKRRQREYEHCKQLTAELENNLQK